MFSQQPKNNFRIFVFAVVLSNFEERVLPSSDTLSASLLLLLLLPFLTLFPFRFREAVDVERFFVCSALPCDVIGMNSRLMSQYIEFVADRLLTALGVPKIYNATNPFDWMELISLQGKTNFFEKRVAEYQKAGVSMPNDTKRFELNEEF